MIGEARMAARRIKTLLRDGVAAEDIHVCVRDLTPYADLLREVFDEYGIPVDVEGTDSLLHDPAVALLLRALRLPDEDWPFAGVTALLRSSLLRPRWPEVQADPDVLLLSDALLRLLREPRGRDAYLNAVHRWALRPEAGLEDEAAEESRRLKTHELARHCEAFLARFFGAWDAMPALGRPEEHISWLRGFLDEIGLSNSTPAWERFRDEIGRWIERDTARGRTVDRRTFQRRLHALASTAGTARNRRGPGRVCVLSAPLACNLDVDHLFILGLGERGFPQLATPSALLDESERQALCGQGLDLVCAADLLPEEMLLFYRLATRARKQLVLGYPAVDERGQPLLPSSFLSAIVDLFEPDAVETQKQTMLIEGFHSDEPLSPAEDRVRLALSLGREPRASAPRGSSPMLDNLRDAAALFRQRCQARALGPFEGMFHDPCLMAEVGGLFGPERVFSPTALEDFVACPFRFFLGHVLRLEPLEEPTEEIEVTRRGQSFHRALARMHSALKKAGINEPVDGVEQHVRKFMSEAIAEDVARAPGPAAKRLWEIEGERMLKVSERYPSQWKALVDPWRPHGVVPRPHFFEIAFGLPPEGDAEPNEPLVIRVDGIEVRISGRIDRVDIADMDDGAGFWILDYKTGVGSHYTSRALMEFQRLQLTLYALAVERVLLARQNARPLGLAYWLVGEDGPKVVMPERKPPVQWLTDRARWEQVRQTLEGWVVSLIRHVREGKYPLRPRSETCTQTCCYGQVCRITQARTVEKDWTLPLPVLNPEARE